MINIRGNVEIVSPDFLKPRQSTHRYPTDFLLGDLLVKAGIVSQKQLDDAVHLAGSQHLNVGQMLIVARYITARDLQAAVDAQSSLRDRVVDMNTAIRGLKAACRAGIPFSEAVRVQDPGATKSIPTNKLGELLLEANIIDGDQFGKALQRSLATGLPLGRILVLNGAINETLLTTALEIQVRVRDDMLTRQEAIDYLMATSSQKNEEGISPEKSLKIQALLKAPRKTGIRLGELLVLAGVLGETDVMNALELGLVNDQPIGQILVAQGFVSPELLDSALRLQALVDSGHLDGNEAAVRLRQINESGVAFSEVVSDIEYEEAPRPVVNFQTMLTLGRVVSEDDFQAAFDLALTSPQVVATVLMMTGYMDEAIADATLKCHSMILDGYLNQEDALVALDYCLQKLKERSITYEESLQELGWSVPPELLEGIGLASLEVQAGSTMSFAVDEQQEPVSNLVATAEEPYAQQEQIADTGYDGRNGDELTGSGGEYSGVYDSESSSEAEPEGEEQPETAEPVGPQHDWSLPEAQPEAEEVPPESPQEVALEESPVAEEAGGEPADSHEPEPEAPAAVPPLQSKRSVSLSQMKETARQMSQSRISQSHTIDVPKESDSISETTEAVTEAETESASNSESRVIDNQAAEAQSLIDGLSEQVNVHSDTGPTNKALSDKDKQSRKTRNSLRSLLVAQPSTDESNGSGTPKVPPVHKRDFAEATIDPDAAIAAISEPTFRSAKKGDLELNEEEQAIIARASSLSATPEDMEAAARIVGRKQDAVRPFPAAGEDLKKKISESEFGTSVEVSPEKAKSEPDRQDADAESTGDKHKFEDSGLGTLLGKGKSEGTKTGSSSGKSKTPPSGLGAHLGTGKAKGGAINEALGRAKFEDSGLGAHLGKPKSKGGGLGTLLGKPKTEDNGRKAAEARALTSGDSIPSLAESQQEHASAVTPMANLGFEFGITEANQHAATAKPEVASLGELSKAIAPGLAEEQPFVLNDSLIRLAESYYEQGKYVDAENLYNRILKLREKESGPEHANLVGDLNNLAGVLCVQGKFKEAEPHVERAVGMIEKLEPGESLKLADSLNTLAGIYFQQEKFDQCELLLTRALNIREKLLGEDHQDVADNLRDYAKFLKKINRAEEAEKLYARAREIVARAKKSKS